LLVFEKRWKSLNRQISVRLQKKKMHSVKEVEDTLEAQEFCKSLELRRSASRIEHQSAIVHYWIGAHSQVL
jgi:hypothetical protein